MKTNLEKLTSLLCECEEVKKDLKQKEYIVSITSKDNSRINNQIFGYNFGECNSMEEAKGLSIAKIRQQENNKNNHILIEVCSVVDKEIEYHHLMMYCEEKYSISITSSYINISDGKLREVFINIENSKPLHQQSEETLGKIFNFLK